MFMIGQLISGVENKLANTKQTLTFENQNSRQQHRKVCLFRLAYTILIFCAISSICLQCVIVYSSSISFLYIIDCIYTAKCI